MNSTVESILDHRSIRSYTNTPIEEDKLQAVINSAQMSPSSINGQQMSIVLIKDQATRDKIAELAGGQPWISQAPVFMLFVADFYRAKLAAEKSGQELVIAGNMEGTLVGSIDVGLAMGHAIVAAESLGLGTVCIGGVRNNPDEMIKLLNLPEYVYPMVGLCIGYANEDTIPDKKPRFPQAAVVHDEVYNSDLSEVLNTYDNTIEAYMTQRTGGKDTRDWSHFVSSFYNRVYYPKVSGTLKDQKFNCE